MELIVTDDNDRGGLLRQAVAALQATSPEMVIVPVPHAATTEEALRILRSVPQFVERRESDADLNHRAVGVIRLGKVRTVHDALDEDIKDVTDLLTAARCSEDEHVPGSTCRLETMLGPINVDLEQFSRRTGLPLRSEENNEYSMILRAVATPEGGTRIVAVALKGRINLSRRAGYEPDDEDVLVDLLARLAEKRRAGTAGDSSFYFRDFLNGWQFFYCNHFNQVCGWLRGDRFHTLKVENGELVIKY